MNRHMNLQQYHTSSYIQMCLLFPMGLQSFAYDQNQLSKLTVMKCLLLQTVGMEQLIADISEQFH